MAAQSKKTAAPMTAEQMKLEDTQINPEKKESVAETEPVADPILDEEIDLKEDPRAKLYESIDMENEKEWAKPGFLSAEPEEEETPAPAPEETPAPAEEVKPPEEETSPPATQEEEAGEPGEKTVLSRAEFCEVFSDFQIRDKVAGEVVEAPVDEWIRGTGLEKHYTKRLMDLSRKEQDLLKQASPKPTEVPTEDEIQARYDELYMDSPYRANAYLEEIRDKKSQQSSSPEADETVRARAAYEEFTSAYPDLSQEDWARMNDVNFWQQHADVVQARERKEWFPVFVLAYNHLQREKLDEERVQVREAMKKKQSTDAQIIARKRDGQVIRSASAPKPEKPKPQKAPSVDEVRLDYIAQLKRNARTRMNIQD